MSTVRACGYERSACWKVISLSWFWSNKPFKRLWALWSCKNKSALLDNVDISEKVVYIQLIDCQSPVVKSLIDMSKSTAISDMMDNRRGYLWSLHLSISLRNAILPLPLLLVLDAFECTSLLWNRDFPKNRTGRVIFP